MAKRRRPLGQYDACRLLYHAWDQVPRPPDWKGRATNVLHLRCLRCGSYRHDSFDILGRLMTRSYERPEGYGYTRDEVPSRESLRLGMAGGRRGPR
jgi:hypothetical protein